MIKKFNIFNYIFKESKEKRNLILIFLISFIFLGLFLSLTMIRNNNDKIKFYSEKYIPNVKFEVIYDRFQLPRVKELSNKLENKTLTKSQVDEINYEILYLVNQSEESEEEEHLYKKIETIEHVIDVMPRKYNRELRMEFADGYEEGDDKHKQIYAKPLQYESDIKLLYGNYPNENEIVCPSKMVFTNNLDYYSKFLDKQNQYNTKINDTFKVFNDKLNNNKNDTSILKIVGIYDNTQTHDKLNTCYTSIDTVNNFNTSEGYISQDYNGQTMNISMELFGVSVRVDKKENVQKVKKEIEDLGLDIFDYGKVSFVQTYINKPYYIGGASIFILIIIIVLFIRKKCIYKKYNYGLMKVQGYSQNKIIQIELLENVITTTVGFIISVLLFCILFKLVPYQLVYNYEVYGDKLYIPFKYIILAYPIIIMIITIITIIIVNKYSKNSIISNLEVI